MSSWALETLSRVCRLQPTVPLTRLSSTANQVLMYTAMKSIFEDKNKQEDLFFKGPGKDLDVRSDTHREYAAVVPRAVQYRRRTSSVAYYLLSLASPFVLCTNGAVPPS